MPDITMCGGKNCPQSTTCHRYMATPSKFMQSYFTNPPVKEDGTCNYYWKIEGGNK